MHIFVRWVESKGGGEAKEGGATENKKLIEREYSILVDLFT